MGGLHVDMEGQRICESLYQAIILVFSVRIPRMDPASPAIRRMDDAQSPLPEREAHSSPTASVQRALFHNAPGPGREEEECLTDFRRSISMPPLHQRAALSGHFCCLEAKENGGGKERGERMAGMKCKGHCVSRRALESCPEDENLMAFL